MTSVEEIREAAQRAEEQGLAPFSVFGVWVGSEVVVAVVLAGHVAAVDEDEGAFERWSEHVYAASPGEAEAVAVKAREA